MPRVRLFHWKHDEAGPVIQKIRDSGYIVEYDDRRAVPVSFRGLRASPPHAIVIDLTRQPSHGRYVALTIRSQKSIRHIPIVFVDGDPEKVNNIRAELPDAIYTARRTLASALKRAKPLANPVVVDLMAGYANRSIAQKLGIREGMRVAVMDAPRDYARTIGKLPSRASLEEEADEVLPLTLWFVHDSETFLEQLPRMRQLVAAGSRIWLIYKKQKTRAVASMPRDDNRLTQFFIRDSALSVGLVDYKICAVGDIWSGLLFTKKR